MPNHIKVIMESEAKDMDGIFNIPVANYMFQVREYVGTLMPVQADLFQTLVAKILFFSFRSRPDLKTALDFLTTQIRNPDENYYKNLAHTIWYIRATQGMELTLEAESIDAI